MTKQSLLEHDCQNRKSWSRAACKISCLHTCLSHCVVSLKSVPQRYSFTLFQEQTETNAVGLSIYHPFSCVTACAVSNGLAVSLGCVCTEGVSCPIWQVSSTNFRTQNQPLEAPLPLGRSLMAMQDSRMSNLGWHNRLGLSLTSLATQ